MVMCTKDQWERPARRHHRQRRALQSRFATSHAMLRMVRLCRCQIDAMECKWRLHSL